MSDVDDYNKLWDEKLRLRKDIDALLHELSWYFDKIETYESEPTIISKMAIEAQDKIQAFLDDR